MDKLTGLRSETMVNQQVFSESKFHVTAPPAQSLSVKANILEISVNVSISLLTRLHKLLCHINSILVHFRMSTNWLT